ncbi:GMP synthase [Siphonobacter sp. BAB-5385]|uniref:type 1 glutamine amidotransferase n=1 Tax=Siphonobacter sp. BAB-5385 TaxID=1864822 RepID=UPI000B9E2955|nr:GMP synthase [Siphonobacter sp. BAB-5385]OZI09281.1 GMP synthase [Siphonobacter sp. BAB-5385]
MKQIRLAILDLYNGVPNEGMRCIQQLVQEFSEEIGGCVVQIFDVRQQGELPALADFDIFISTGGPGNPLETGDWGTAYFDLIDQIFEHNKTQTAKKFLLLICHSFQMVSHHLGIGTVTRRKSTSFGTFPIHKTANGYDEPYLELLPDPFWAVDSRDYQIINANFSRIDAIGAKVLCREKIRPHVPLERAIMAVRFSREVFGTQFHPEADAVGMLRYFQQPEKQKQVIDEHGYEKYQNMVDHLNDPDKILLTESVIIPTFLRDAYHKLAAN